MSANPGSADFHHLRPSAKLCEAEPTPPLLRNLVLPPCSSNSLNMSRLLVVKGNCTRSVSLLGRHIPPSESIWNKARERRKTTPPRVQFANVQNRRSEPCSQFAEIIAKYYRKWRYAKPRIPRIPILRCIRLATFHLLRGARGFQNSSSGPVRTMCHRFCLVGVPRLAQLKTPNPTGGEGVE